MNIPKKNKAPVSVSFRLPREVYDEMEKILQATGKPSANFCSFAVQHYMAVICNRELKDDTPLRLDTYACKILKEK